MSFKNLIFVFFFVLSACGVKGDPTPPSDSLLPSVESHYLRKASNEKESTKEEKENAEKASKKEKQ